MSQEEIDFKTKDDKVYAIIEHIKQLSKEYNNSLHKQKLVDSINYWSIKLEQLYLLTLKED